MYYTECLKRIILVALFILVLPSRPVLVHADETNILLYQAEQLITQKFSSAEKQQKACKQAINLLWRSYEITPDSNTLLEIAEGYDILGQPQKSVELSEQAFQIATAAPQKDERQKEKIAFTAQILGDHYRHSGRFKKAIESYSTARSLDNRSKNLETSLNLCKQLLKQKQNLRLWLESDETPDETSIIVPYATYSISMTKRNGKYHVSLPLIFRYNGSAQKKQMTVNRLRKIIPMVEKFYNDNGIQLNINYKIADRTQLLSNCKNEINIWYEHTLTVLGKGQVPAMNVGNWSLFKLNQRQLSKNAAAYSIAHEIGHLLGFNHPAMYLGPFHPAVIEFGNSFTRYSLMSYNSINSSRGFPDAFYIESQNKKRLLRPLLRPHPADLAAAKLAKAYLHKNRLLLKEAILDLKKALSHAPDKQLVAEFLYRFNDVVLASYTQRIAANPNDFYMRLKRSKFLIENDRWAAAIHDLNRIVSAYQSVGGRTETIHSLRLWPEVIAEALYLRSICLAKLGKHHQAEDDFDAFVSVLTTGTDLKHIGKIPNNIVGNKLTASN